MMDTQEKQDKKAGALPVEKREKWYVGAKRDYPYTVFRWHADPTERTHGRMFAYCFGPYATKCEAVFSICGYVPVVRGGRRFSFSGKKLKKEKGNTHKEMKTHTQEWFEEAFTNPVTRQAYKVPAKLRVLSERICRSYGIKGICDPMYIANVAALELGMGDGKSNFKPNSCQE